MNNRVYTRYRILLVIAFLPLALNAADTGNQVADHRKDIAEVLARHPLSAICNNSTYPLFAIVFSYNATAWWHKSRLDGFFTTVGYEEKNINDAHKVTAVCYQPTAKKKGFDIYELNQYFIASPTTLFLIHDIEQLIEYIHQRKGRNHQQYEFESVSGEYKFVQQEYALERWKAIPIFPLS